MQDYDNIVLVEPLDPDLPAGTEGTIVMTFMSQITGQPKAYLSEFFDAQGETIAVAEALDSKVSP